jgi:ATP-binding cassette subfamily B protein
MARLYEEQSIMDGSVVIKNLTFRYSIGKDVFDSLNLTIEHGQHVGVVGSTGAGKSTLIAMLMKLRDPIGGIIEIGGSDIADMAHDALRRQIAIVPQDVSLLHRTIFENIAYGKEDTTIEEVIAAAKKAKIHDEIALLTNGYHTVVGERGIKLSGGQRQRVAIARALLIDAKIIILDEATSSLDAITETHVQDILQNHLEGRTVIIIAHRLATVRHCDRIIVLNDGKITEDGPHEALMQNDGTYSELVRHQFAH